jgi:hypothetical protein
MIKTWPERPGNSFDRKSRLRRDFLETHVEALCPIDWDRYFYTIFNSRPRSGLVQRIGTFEYDADHMGDNGDAEADESSNGSRDVEADSTETDTSGRSRRRPRAKKGPRSSGPPKGESKN